MRNYADETYCLFVCMSVCLSVNVSVCLYACKSVSVSVCLLVCQYIYLSVRLTVCPSVDASVSPSVCYVCVGPSSLWAYVTSSVSFVYHGTNFTLPFYQSYSIPSLFLPPCLFNNVCIRLLRASMCAVTTEALPL